MRKSKGLVIIFGGLVAIFSFILMQVALRNYHQPSKYRATVHLPIDPSKDLVSRYHVASGEPEILQNESLLVTAQDTGTLDTEHAITLGEPQGKTHRIIESTRAKVSEDLIHLEPHEYTLNASLLSGLADDDNTVVITWANFAMLDFALNWVHHCKAAGMNNYLVGAMDGRVLAELVKAKVPVFAMQGVHSHHQVWQNRTKHDLGRDDRFHSMGREKIHLVGTIVSLGFNLLLSDVDTVWLRNPMPFFQKYPEADVLCSSDTVGATTTDGGLELPKAAHSAANIGVMFVRRGFNSQTLAGQWMHMLKDDPKMWDQNGFNMLVRRNLHTHHHHPGMTKDGEVRNCELCRTVHPSRVFSIMNGGAMMGLLPVTLFAGGHHYFVSHLPQQQSVVPFVVHSTFQFSGNEGKRHRLREAKLWVDPPDYYDHPRGFVTYTPHIPEDLVKFFRNYSQPNRPLSVNDTHILEQHFKLMNIQILQLRQAVSLSVALGRVLILPQLTCGLDRWWAPHAGRTPGAHQLQLPFQCPFDHVMDVVKWLYLPTFEFHFREHSFLDNPRLSSKVKFSRAKVHLCGEDLFIPGSVKESLDESGRVKCPVFGPEDSGVATLHVPIHKREAKFRTLRVAGLKVLEIENMPIKDMIRWEENEDKEELEKWFVKAHSTWCCVMPPPGQTFGHIHYDMFPDRIGVADRHGFQRTGAFQVNLGP